MFKFRLPLALLHMVDLDRQERREQRKQDEEEVEQATEWEYTERAQAERDRWTKRINEDMRNNPNLIWKSSWGGAPWYNTTDRYLRKSLRRKKQGTKRTISAKLRDPKESRSVGIAAVVILTLAAPMLILGLALVGALALFIATGGG